MSNSIAAKRESSRFEFVALLAALMALNALAIDVILPAFPHMSEAFGLANENDRQLVLSIYMLGMGLAQIVFGPLSDRFGRRPPLIFGIIVYVITAALAIFAPSFFSLLALRFVQGLGAAATRVIALSVVRDRYSGRAMAEIMSLVFMVFMVIPIIAPSIGQVILLAGEWHAVFIFMSGLAALIGLWAFFRLPETLHPENRRPFTAKAILEGFRIVLSNRVAMLYSLCSAAIFGALFGFVNASQQIYAEVYGIAEFFPIAFAGMAALMAVASFTNSRIVGRFGQRRISHTAILIFTFVAAILLGLALAGPVDFWIFYASLSIMMFFFGWTVNNFNSLAMEPLGKVAGTASSVFGFIQTISGALLGLSFGRLFDGTLVPMAASYFAMGAACIVFILIAEQGKLFGTSETEA